METHRLRAVRLCLYEGPDRYPQKHRASILHRVKSLTLLKVKGSSNEVNSHQLGNVLCQVCFQTGSFVFFFYVIKWKFNSTITSRPVYFNHVIIWLNDKCNSAHRLNACRVSQSLSNSISIELYLSQTHGSNQVKKTAIFPITTLPNDYVSLLLVCEDVST